MTTKIATCCYCGTRAALVLEGRGRHELACASCGAPLHEMKMLRKDKTDRRAPAPARRGGAHSRPQTRKTSHKSEKSGRSKIRKKRKSVMRGVLGEVFDLIEDIFD